MLSEISIEGKETREFMGVQTPKLATIKKCTQCQAWGVTHQTHQTKIKNL